VGAIHRLYITRMTFKLRMITHEAFSGLGFGIMLAVLGVFYVKKGLSLWQISLLFGTVGASNALFELPFGAAADIYGRLRIYRLSRLILIGSVLLLLASPAFWLILVAAAGVGLAQALDSGTVDAWMVERIKDQGLEAKLQRFIGTFQASMAAGITLGAIIGGYIPKLMPATPLFPATGWNLILAAALASLHLITTYALFHEGECRTQPTNHGQIKSQMRNAIAFSLQNHTLRHLLLLGVVLGVAMFSVEAYWQPRLIEITQTPTYAAFGWVTAGYFAMAILGPLLISTIAEKTTLSPRIQLLVLPFILAGVLMALALQSGFGFFIAAYLAFMLVVSMLNPPAMTLLNREAPDEMRSTLQSLFSFVLRLGGGIAAFAFAPVVQTYGISATWMLGAGIVLVAGVILLMLSPRKIAA